MQYCGLADPQEVCGPAFFRNPDLSNDIPVDWGQYLRNVTGMYPSPNGSTVTLEFASAAPSRKADPDVDSTEADSASTETDPGSDDQDPGGDSGGGFRAELSSALSMVDPASGANVLETIGRRGYVLNTARQYERVLTATVSGSSTWFGETAFVCVLSSVVIRGVDYRLECVHGSIAADANTQAAVDRWCRASVAGVAFDTVLGGYCGVHSDSVFLAFKDEKGETQFLAYPSMTSDAMVDPALGSEMASLVAVDGVRDGAGNGQAMAVQISQSLFLFGDAAAGGATDEGEHVVRNALNPVAGSNSISARTSARAPLFFGDIGLGIGPGAAWLVNDIFSAPWSPCYVAVDLQTHQLVSWGAAEVCSPYAESSEAAVGLASIQTAITSAAAAEETETAATVARVVLGGDVFAAVLSNGQGFSWGAITSGAAGPLGTIKANADGAFQIAATGGAVAFTSADGLTQAAGQAAFGGEVADSTIAARLANAVVDLYSAPAFFLARTYDDELVVWNGDYQGVYGAKSTLVSRRYDYPFLHPLGTDTQILALMQRPCAYSDWLPGDCLDNLETDSRTVDVPPINAICTQPLERETSCGSSSTESSSTTQAPEHYWTTKYLVGTVVGATLLALVVGLLYILWAGKQTRTYDDDDHL
ncbi:putative transmembrane protein [Gregarina niphandrodes]|uniref:Transmembrane protein n=1 Tax=Gregarina niphandrodes TaxID=110365 RepID=A0A023BBA9_GRENI|nr:putative transmembrane protein [Gregarina niphandrodes]EZG79121.1 putative transmembrane protein [Gregarina niphandrodes]|eukprot:XP_011129129.1 putative transmembrane protein [Gregarina niphandrodes]